MYVQTNTTLNGSDFSRLSLHPEVCLGFKLLVETIIIILNTWAITTTITNVSIGVKNH